MWTPQTSFSGFTDASVTACRGKHASFKTSNRVTLGNYTIFFIFETDNGSIFPYDVQALAYGLKKYSINTIHILIWFGLSQGLGQANVSSSG